MLVECLTVSIDLSCC